jgi:hypothetical protein
MPNDTLGLITPEESLEQLVPPVVRPEPVLITAQQVALGTAVALRPRHSTMRRWVQATGALLATMEHALVAPKQDDRPKRRDYPKRYAFLDNACMAREMDRL